MLQGGACPLTKDTRDDRGEAPMYVGEATIKSFGIKNSEHRKNEFCCHIHMCVDITEWAGDVAPQVEHAHAPICRE